MKRLLLLLPGAAAILMGSAFADSVTLKSGEKIDGKIMAETPDSVTIRFDVSGGIRDERVIGRAEIEKVEKAQADEILYQQIRGIKSDPMNSLTAETYEGMITTLKDFLSKFPSSPHAAELQSNLDALTDEMARLKAGSVKFNGAWLTMEEAERRKVQIEGQQQLTLMKDLAAHSDLLGALNTFALIEKSYVGTRAYPPAIELARQLVAALKRDVERRQSSLKAEEADYQKHLALASEPTKTELLDARKREIAQADAQFAAAEKAGIKWKPFLPRSTKSIEALARDSAAETTRLATLPVPAMKTSLELTDKAKLAIASKDFGAVLDEGTGLDESSRRGDARRFSSANHSCAATLACRIFAPAISRDRSQPIGCPERQSPEAFDTALHAGRSPVRCGRKAIPYDDSRRAGNRRRGGGGAGRGQHFQPDQSGPKGRLGMSRAASVTRKTNETDIAVELLIDGRGGSAIDTKIPFFDHMLTLFARHSLVDLKVKADGDIEVDLHHTVEDVGIALGQAFARALGDKRGIRRYGWAYLPMDETLTRTVLDFSGRPFLEYRAPQAVEPIGTFSFQLVEEFLRGFSVHAAANLHVEVLYGRDGHHMAESIFKGLAKAVDQACQLDPRVTGVPSTKGVL